MAVDGRVVRGVARRISELIVLGNRADYDLGGEIEKVWDEKMWEAWDGTSYSSFNEWCWGVLGFKERKARYLRSNYCALAGMGVAADTLDRALRMGWTKLAHVLRVARNEIDLHRWIDRVEDEKLSEEDLRAEVALALAPAVDASEMGDPDSDGRDEPRASTDPERKRLIKYPMTFTNEDDLRIFVKALKLIRQRVNPEMSFGEAAALMATSYLGVAARDDEGGLAVELESLIQGIERSYNVKLEVATDQPAPRYATATPTPEATGDGDAAFDGF